MYLSLVCSFTCFAKVLSFFKEKGCVCMVRNPLSFPKTTSVSTRSPTNAISSGFAFSWSSTAWPPDGFCSHVLCFTFYVLCVMCYVLLCYVLFVMCYIYIYINTNTKYHKHIHLRIHAMLIIISLINLLTLVP